ncbi:MAG: NDP-hexose 2,3-dehydratase family protein [bacterium]|nr:NDP-hexose 2,3-dehydratase family protein [bacterium]
MRPENFDAHSQAARLHHDLERVLHFSGESPNVDFFVSSLTEHNPFNSTAEVADWLDQLNRTPSLEVEPVLLTGMRDWYFDPFTGDLMHGTGGFFAIRGLEIFTNVGPVQRWTQPIIDQPKIGVLGMLTKKIDGILFQLIQAKVEPGNLNGFQLAPTVQATRSNYRGLHGGKPIPYLEYFLNGKPSRILFDQHQTEQGARFYHKRNRNLIVQIPDDEEIELLPHFRWVTLGQLKRLMLRNDTVNMDARSVISTISFCPGAKAALHPIRLEELEDCLGSSPLVSKPLDELKIKLMLSACSDEPPLHSMDELLRMLSREKFQTELETTLIPLREVRSWTVSPQEIAHERGLYFSVIGVRVKAESREVPSWDQPIIKQHHAGIVGFIIKEINGVMHFLVQLKLESGNIDLLGMAPTVQCITGSYEHANLPPYVGELLKPTQTRVVFDTMQSEEGGRFYRESNRNLLVQADDSFPVDAPPRYLWLSLKQLKQFLTINNFLNVESRSLLAII